MVKPAQGNLRTSFTTTVTITVKPSCPSSLLFKDKFKIETFFLKEQQLLSEVLNEDAPPVREYKLAVKLPPPDIQSFHSISIKVCLYTSFSNI